jgi:predicted CopG family antitoxin
MNETALIKHGIYSKLNSLSGKELHSISDFIDFVHHKKKGSTKKNNIKLQGILTGYSLDIADIKKIRNDSWKHLERELGNE